MKKIMKTQLVLISILSFAGALQNARAGECQFTDDWASDASQVAQETLEPLGTLLNEIVNRSGVLTQNKVTMNGSIYQYNVINTFDDNHVYGDRAYFGLNGVLSNQVKAQLEYGLIKAEAWSTASTTKTDQFGRVSQIEPEHCYVRFSLDGKKSPLINSSNGTVIDKIKLSKEDVAKIKSMLKDVQIY